jgi:hypothetical protein
MPAEPDPIVLEAVQRALDSPPEADPTGGSIFILGLSDYETNFRSGLLHEANSVRRWYPSRGGSEQGIAFFAQWPWLEEDEQ